MEVPTGRPVEGPMERRAEVPTGRPAEVPMERRVEVPTERPVEGPMERRAEVPTERRVEVPAERRAEGPTTHRAQTRRSRAMTAAWLRGARRRGWPSARGILRTAPPSAFSFFSSFVGPCRRRTPRGARGSL